MLLKEENKGVGRKNLVFAGLPINFTVNAFKVLISFLAWTNCEYAVIRLNYNNKDT